MLDRILDYFDAEGHKYHLVNLSIGPNTPYDDGDVTLWTSALDERFASGEWVVTVAAGNDGEADATLLLNRIQPPGDGVNVLTVGASDSVKNPWKREPYSCVGPGRTPGFVKPDGLSFGRRTVSHFACCRLSLKLRASREQVLRRPLRCVQQHLSKPNSVIRSGA